MPFELNSKFEPAGGQPQAIKEIVQLLDSNQKHQTLLGITGSGKTFTIANILKQTNRPTLVLSHNKTLASQLYMEFKSFFPNNLVEYFVSYYDYYQPEAFIPSSNVYIEKDFSKNEAIERMRLSATTALLTGRRDVIVVSSVSCIYGIGNPENFKKNILHYSVGDTIVRNVFLRNLVNAQYSRSGMEESVGTFRVKGDTVDIFLAYETIILRFVFWGNEIESIVKLDPETLQKMETLQSVRIYPNDIFVTNTKDLPEILFEIQKELKDRINYYHEMGQKLEAKRLEDRVTEDIEMMRELGYCSGIENYSRYFDRRKKGERPFCLLDYFPNDFLMVIDESHATLPQIGGMYAGDRSRKNNLVEYGFRLPSALDNRPLKFNEFESVTGQNIYVSATPGDYEIEKSEGIVVEQVVRPTGLLDPVIEVRSSLYQVDNLIGEVEKRVEVDEKVLITTLTKRMSEELTSHLINHGVRAKYIHSDIDTIERVEILKGLRLGSFDVLVGINLLREGIDLPEVSLVAILDADKEGFLRSERSLIQISGRAARNENGKVLMYAEKVTKSMQKVIDTTRERRIIQEAFNKKHGITPQTVRKSRDEIMKQASIIESDKKNYEPAIFADLLVAESAEKYVTRKELPSKISELEKSMKEASDRLDFVLAQKLKDKVFELKSQLKKT